MMHIIYLVSRHIEYTLPLILKDLRKAQELSKGH